MSEKIKTLAVITLFVDDLSASVAWYSRVFDFPLPTLDPKEDGYCFKLDNLMINLLITSSAEVDFVGKGGVTPRDGGRRALYSLWSDDFDTDAEKLLSRGVKFVNPPEVKPWNMKVATFEDPSGHLWELAAPVKK